MKSTSISICGLPIVTALNNEKIFQPMRVTVVATPLTEKPKAPLLKFADTILSSFGI
jgi:hypothetical protein